MGFHSILWRLHEDLVIYLGINSGPCMSHSGGWIKIGALYLPATKIWSPGAGLGLEVEGRGAAFRVRCINPLFPKAVVKKILPDGRVW